MAQSLADVIVHIVFSTKDRKSLIHPDIQSEFYAYICGICNNLNSPVIRINGVEDHVHILLLLGRTISLSDLISKIKSNSSTWIKKQGVQYTDFAWQRGFGAFSVSRRQIEGAVGYIEGQKEHHKTVSFKDELISMLKLAQIAYDEKYLWD